MPKWIIGYGWRDVDVIDAASLEAATAEATKRSKADGILEDELEITTWAEAYDDLRARDLGLLDPPLDRHASWWS